MYGIHYRKVLIKLIEMEGNESFHYWKVALYPTFLRNDATLPRVRLTALELLKRSFYLSGSGEGEAGFSFL